MAEPDPENAIRATQSGSGVCSERDVELVAENEVLNGDVTPGPEAGQQTPEQ